MGKVLWYFGNYCQAEAIRMLLHHAKVKFDDRVLTLDEFKIKKKEFPNEALPCYQDDYGHKYSESKAILRFLGTQYGYYPVRDLKLCWKADAIVDFASEMIL